MPGQLFSLIKAAFVGAALSMLLAAPSAVAQDQIQPQTQTEKDAILILDASGSMWGQVEGVNKIVIAKDVVEQLVRSLPVNQRLGFVAYGHRRAGDCADIETLADVGAPRADVIEKLRNLSPKGKTPLSQSVQHAADALNYKKNAASIILVSDGLETCDVDPCALARTLEENGLDFTVHVIGFDVTREERAGLQCIADETGGTFLAADNADELTDALSQVAVMQAAPDTRVPVAALPPAVLALKATILSGGPLIQSKLDWTVTPKEGGEPVYTASDEGPVNTTIPPGDYVVDVVWHGWSGGGEKTGHTELTIKPNQSRVQTVPVDLDLPVTLNFEPQTSVGVPVDVTWTGPDALGAAVSVNRPDDPWSRHIFFFPAAKARGDVPEDAPATAALGAPVEPGTYEVRYTISKPPLVLARKPLTVVDATYTLTAPETAPVSTQIEIAWEGPLTKGDIITLVPAGDERAFDNGNYRVLKEGVPAKLTTPAEPGDYELRYVMHGGYTTYEGMQHAVRTSIHLKVTAVSATVSGPAQVVGGSTFDVTWTGPEGWENDFLSIVEPGAEKFERLITSRLSKVEQGAPAPIRAPAIPGDYEIVYFIDPGQKAIARTPLAVTAPRATVDAPDTVKAGTSFTVTYSGDGFPGDRVVVAPASAPDGKMWGYTARYGFFAKAGETQGTVTDYPIAAGPGDYEVRYVTGLQHQVIARDRFIVVE